ncbi:ANL_collapsed_G0003430.mRNA.1.CDS.1 [Saccharomyces cerevisiae]|uniref:Amn1p n=4 Tax=Saccharomyces cerevisiae TaxID=4932 RepID=C7GUU6_YEAS2|nr:Amn1p [Saccharomyces cerevisiae YJM1415]AJP82907.1 Amn1p [Saccharomyces cerevisiae YJM1417]AJP86349.1 Amn1p [Saccharomyces cerevisiae YJM1450]AJP87503.1 Amn1p [Saccharomyces cerevisiae YJM1477]AJP88621.1 Amn1p [Saccharomyces cerevisiae YJM1526]AJP90091.1 Amn1p [Saccharomyces cerevisiae YJM1574]AJP91247.1 Amn1p [Saccharomyces cerevisiae YJM693]AJP95524.1 Amn1p [Saccharomyces cerevisiae YJM1129]AJP96298.1 Amn1p [Saccharomyces cerevisiae YJM1190]AJP96680.1 Amn1p [Saccharomyces cerevisiae Y
MKLERVSSNGSFKRGRDIQSLESPCTRPLKKMSPSPSFTSLKMEKPFKDIVRKYGGHLHQSSYNPGSSKVELVRPDLSLKTDQSFLQSSVQTTPNKKSCNEYLSTPEATPLKNTATENAWATSRVVSASSLSIVTPTEIKNILVDEFSELKLGQPLTAQHQRSHAVFEIPEIVENIIKMIVSLESANIPKERPCLRRNPQSYEHSLLMYKDEERAKKAWSAAQQLQDPPLVGRKEKKQGALFSCMMVNRLWLNVTRPFLFKSLHFKSVHNFKEFLRTSQETTQVMRPSHFILHKLHQVTQPDIERLSRMECQNLKWLEFYVCPRITPPLSWFDNLHKLEKLIIPGNKNIDDNFLLRLSQSIPNLKHLDLRACDNVSDSGVVCIALNCPKLKTFNIGRHRRGNLITSVSLVALGKYTQVETVGFAGCDVDDAGIWEFARLNGKNVERLSLNSCRLLTDYSLPILFALNSFPNLAVLEIRNLDKITDVRHFVKYNLWKKSLDAPILIEACERITKLIDQEENRVKRINSLVALKDMTAWVNADDEIENNVD